MASLTALLVRGTAIVRGFRSAWALSKLLLRHRRRRSDNRLATHTAYHVGQIVLLAKHFAGPRWTSLSIPKGQSKQYARGKFKQGIIPIR